MIESVERIHNRINEIQDTFKKLGFAPVDVNMPSKPFSEYLNNAVSNEGITGVELDGSIIDNVRTDINQNILDSIVDNNPDISSDYNITLGMFGGNEGLTPNLNKVLEIYKNVSDSFPKIYDPIINEASKKYSVPENLIKAVIKQESNYMPNAVSSKGAIGLMQLMPDTAKELGVDVNNLKEPYTNIMAGTRYLSQMLNKYDGRLDLSLSAYNAGPSLVDRLQRIPNIEETQNYVKNIINYIK